MSFIPWIDDNNVNATQDYNTYLNDSQRKEGFKGGTPASAIRVNTALRQANLVVTALMNVLDVSSNLNYRSSVEDVQNAINTTLTNKIRTTKVNDASNADNADNANVANYASSDISKGTIDNRLNALGKTVKSTLVTSLQSFITTIANNFSNIIYADLEFTSLIGVSEIPTATINGLVFSGSSTLSLGRTGSESNWFGDKPVRMFIGYCEKYSNNNISIYGTTYAYGGRFDATLSYVASSNTSIMRVHKQSLQYVPDFNRLDLHSFDITINANQFKQATIYYFV